MKNLLLFAFLVLKVFHFPSQFAGVPITVVFSKENCVIRGFVTLGLQDIFIGDVVVFLENNQVSINGIIFNTINPYL